MEAHELDTYDRAPRLTYWHKTLRSLLYLDLLSAESSNAGAGILRHTLDMWHACWVTERHVSGAGALCALSTEAGCSPPQPLECSGGTRWPTCGNCHMCGSTGPRTRATTFVVTTVPAIATNSRSSPVQGCATVSVKCQVVSRLATSDHHNIRVKRRRTAQFDTIVRVPLA